MDQSEQEVRVCNFAELADPDSREFKIGEGDWPFKGFIVRQGDSVYAYQNICAHVGHPLNWQPDRFLTEDGSKIICASHGAIYDIETGVCVQGPCPGRTLRPVRVDVRDGVVYVTAPTGI